MVFLPSSSAARSSRAPLLLTTLVAYGLSIHNGAIRSTQAARYAIALYEHGASPTTTILRQADAEEALLLFAKPISSCGVGLHPPRDDGTVRDVRSP